MSTQPLRVLFCIGINQNFFDLPADGITIGDVWQAFVSMMDQLKALPGITFIGDIDDDAHMVGPSDGWPWTCYILADADSQETVKARVQSAAHDGGRQQWRQVVALRQDRSPDRPSADRPRRRRTARLKSETS